MSYIITPSNYDEVYDFVHEYSTEVQRKIITSSRVFVIDTCAVQFYMRLNRVDFFAKYVSENGGCVIIFRTILMELSGEREYLEKAQINFIETLHSNDVDVYILFEEDLKELLQVYTDNQRINGFLKYAVQCVNGPTGIIKHFLEEHDTIRAALFNEWSVSNPDLYRLFWTELRHEKKHGDNLGEYVCAICIHILAEIEDINPYKYIFLTEDKPAIGIFKAIINARKHNGMDRIGCATSAKVTELMYSSGILKDASDIKNFLAPITSSRIKTSVIDLYAVEPDMRSFTIEEFADYISSEAGRIIV